MSIELSPERVAERDRWRKMIAERFANGAAITKVAELVLLPQEEGSDESRATPYIQHDRTHLNSVVA